MQNFLTFADEFNLRQIPSDLIDRLWSGDANAQDEQALFEATNGATADSLNPLYESVSQLSRKAPPADFWKQLHEHSFPVKAFLAWLFCTVESTQTGRAAALRACSVYFNFAFLCGHSALHSFHPFLFRACLNLLKNWSLAHEESTHLIISVFLYRAVC